MMYIMTTLEGRRHEELSVNEARAHFSDVLARVAYGAERVIVQRRGRPFAALISIDDLRKLEALESEAETRKDELVGVR